jgi:ABC-type bacteriocin/lantibiotic exporter with double-glycine peptidase domain
MLYTFTLVLVVLLSALIVFLGSSILIKKFRNWCLERKASKGISRKYVVDHMGRLQ